MGPPPPDTSCVPMRRKSDRKGAKRHLISSMALHVSKSNYRRVFNQLLSYAPAARRAFRDIVRTRIAREMSRYCRGNSQQFPTFSGIESVKQSFNWKSVFSELRQTIPTLYAAVTSSLPKKLRENTNELGYTV